jgi:hypothetical protein
MIKNILKATYRNIRNIIYRIRLSKNSFEFIYLNFPSRELNRKTKKSIYFFLNDNDSFHYGDKFFFIPLIINCSKYFNVKVVERDREIVKLLELYNIACIKTLPVQKNIVVISYLNCFLHFKNNLNYKFIGIDLKNVREKKNLYPLLFVKFKKIFQIPFDDKRDYFDKFIIKNKENLLNKKFDFIKRDYYLYSEDIKSQNFWTILTKSKFKMRDLAKVKSNKYLILHASIKKRRNILLKNYLNITNKTTFKDVIFLVSNKYCKGVIAYDNIYVHLATIFKKEIHFASRYYFNYKRKKINTLTIPFIKNKISKKKINEIL